MNEANVEEENIGIDLGTTQSCVGVWQNRTVQIIPNDQGKRTTPSYVSFTDHERLIGDSAKTDALMNASNTVFDVKRLIGRKFSDPKVQEDLKKIPYKVVSGLFDAPMIEVEYKGETKQFRAEELSSLVLSKMKDNAEAYIGYEVKNAVITVPASFNYSQRQATKNAGLIAGLNVLQVITKPEASAIAYALEKNDEAECFLVFCLGGGVVDASILKRKYGFLKVCAQAGDSHLGGKDFDDKLVGHCIDDFKRRHLKDVSDNKEAVQRLRIECEWAKCKLSSATEALVKIDSLHEGINYSITIKRECFEHLCQNYFRTCSMMTNARKFKAQDNSYKERIQTKNQIKNLKSCVSSGIEELLSTNPTSNKDEKEEQILEQKLMSILQILTGDCQPSQLEEMTMEGVCGIGDATTTTCKKLHLLNCDETLHAIPQLSQNCPVSLCQ
jgi:heat shock 70kDa protein 1/2/6/8